MINIYSHVGCCVMCDILRAKMLTIIITCIVKLNVGLLIVDLCDSTLETPLSLCSLSVW